MTRPLGFAVIDAGGFARFAVAQFVQGAGPRAVTGRGKHLRCRHPVHLEALGYQAKAEICKGAIPSVHMADLAGALAVRL